MCDPQGRLQKARSQRVAGWDAALPFCSQVQALSPRPHCPRWPPMTFYNRLDKGISIPCTGGETEAQSERTRTSFPPALGSRGVVPGVAFVLP